MKPRESRFFYGWVIALVGFLVSALGYGVRISFSVIFPSLLEQFQWSRDATAAIFSFHLLAYGITAPIAGALVDRIGARKTMGLGVTLLALGAALSSLGNQLWHFYLSFGLLTGVGLCLTGSVSLTRVLALWFLRRRGLALGITFFGGGGAFLFYPLVAFLIEKVDWRGAFLVEAGMVAVLLLPAVVLLIRSHPQEMGLLPDGDQETGTEPGAKEEPGEGVIDKAWAATDWTLPKAMKTYRFWALCACAFGFWGISQQLLIAHQVAFAEDVGYSKLYAASVLSLFGISVSIGCIAGLISDRIGREATFSLGTVSGVLGIVALMLIRDASQPWMLYTYAVLGGLGMGICSPTLAAAATDMFTGRRAGVVIGFVWFSFAVGGTIGPWLGGIIFERRGGYLPAFIVAAAMLVVACLSLWIAAPRQVRPVSGKVKPRAPGVPLSP